MPFKFLYDINKSAAEELINTYHKTGTKNTRLIFPTYSDGCIRVSEQELRFAFAAFIEKRKDYYYGVEVPTTGSFSFTGKGKRSASSDMGIFSTQLVYDDYSENTKNNNIAALKLRIEFKAHNPAMDSISKDIIKLCEEGVEGAFCHILQTSDAGTYSSLFAKLNDAFVKMPPPPPLIPKKCLYFSFIDLQHRVLITLKNLCDSNPLASNIFAQVPEPKYFLTTIGIPKEFDDIWKIEKF